MTEERKTGLEDSGYDCDHCGGEILVSRKVTQGRPVHGYYVCQKCGCEWTLKGDVLHIGVGPNCQASQRERMGGSGLKLPEMGEISVWRRVALIVGGIILFLVLLRFGGFMLFRFLLPILVIGFLIYLVFRLGREQQWW
jgi:hypothetical protein